MKKKYSTISKKPPFVSYISAALESNISYITPISSDIVNFVSVLDSRRKDNKEIVVVSASRFISKNHRQCSNFLDFSEVNEIAIKSYGNKKSLSNLPKGVRVVGFKG